MWALDYKESSAPKNWCFWTVVLVKTLESLLDCKEIQPVHPKGDQSWVFIVKTNVEAEMPVLWAPHAKSWLIWKDPDAGRDWGQEEMGTTEDEMVGCHHWLNAHGFGWTLAVGDGQGGLACCGSWCLKESDTTERLNWPELSNAVMNMGLHIPHWFLFSFPLDICPEVGLLKYMVVIFLIFWGPSRLFFFFFLPCSAECRIIVSQPRIEHMFPTVEAWNPSHWTTRKFPDYFS